MSHLCIFSFCTARNHKLLVLKQEISRFLIYFEFSFNQISHSRLTVVSHGQAEKVSVWGNQNAGTHEERSVVEKADDIRWDGIN